MNVEQIFPFYKKSPLLLERREVCDVRDFWGANEDSRILGITPEGERYLRNKVPKVVKLEPLGYYIMEEPQSVVNWYRSNMASVRCSVNYVDYQSIAKDIELSDDNSEACYPSVNGFENQDIIISDFINSASNGIKLYTPWNERTSSVTVPSDSHTPRITSEGGLMAYLDESMKKLNEIDTTKIQALARLKDFSVNTDGMESPLGVRLESYLLGGYVTDRVPLLLGSTGIAKSQFVKNIAEKHNMRLVDMRVAFMSRLDIEGLSEKVEVDGHYESYNCPMDSMVTCTDNYINYCRAMIPRIQQKLDSVPDDDKEKIEGLTKVLNDFTEGAKPPILFMDEINRSETSTRQALTKILNEKSFMGMDMKIARIVCAANFPLGLPEDLQYVYLTSDIQDVAFLDRFETIPLTPQDNLASWRDWSTQFKVSNLKEQNIHPVIVSFLEENPDEYYNYNDVQLEYEKTDNFDALSSTPFPNYRTWEMLSNYLYKIEQGSKSYINASVVYGLIGNRVGKVFISYASKSGFKLKRIKKEDEMDSFVEDALVSNVPSLIIGSSSIGKSTRIANQAKKMNAEFIEINLAEQDRVDVMGPPVKVDMSKYISGRIANVDSDLADELSSEVTKFDLPQNITVKAPKMGIASKFRNALQEGRPVVLFWDELNRVQNPAMMSAVFECISDSRIFGIDFDPSQVRIIAACNLGENTDEAQSLDPAIAARFNIYKKNGYDLSDVRSFLKYIKKNKYNPYLISFLDNLPDGKILEILKSVESRTIQKSVSSMRSFSDLSKLLDDRNSNILQGSVLFPTVDDERSVSDVIVKNRDETNVGILGLKNGLKSICERINSKLDSWVGLDSGVKTIVGKEEMDIKSLVSNYKDLYNQVYNATDNDIVSNTDLVVALRNTIILLEKSDVELKKSREKIFSFVIGDLSSDFSSYYNTISGSPLEIIEISDLKDVSLIKPYLDKKVSSLVMTDDVINVIFTALEEFYNEFKLSLPVINYVEIINQSVSHVLNSDARMVLLKKMVLSTDVDSMIQKAESSGVDFTKSLLSQIGLSVTDRDISRVTNMKSSSVGKKPVIL